MFPLEDAAKQGHGLVNSDIAKVSAVLYPGTRYHGLCAKFHPPHVLLSRFFVHKLHIHSDSAFSLLRTYFFPSILMLAQFFIPLY